MSAQPICATKVAFFTLVKHRHAAPAHYICNKCAWADANAHWAARCEHTADAVHELCHGKALGCMLVWAVGMPTGAPTEVQQRKRAYAYDIYAHK